MRKAIVTALLLLVFASGAMAQQVKVLFGPVVSRLTEAWPPVHILASESVSLSPFVNAGWGFSFGFGLAFPLGPRLSLGTDALFFAEGAVFEDMKSGYGYRDAYRRAGFRFPLLVRFAPLPPAFPYLLAGPGMSVVLSHRLHSFSKSRIFDPAGPFDVIIDSDTDLTSETRRIALGAIAGIGWTPPVVGRRLSIEVRYEIGLTNLHDRSGGIYGPIFNSRSRSLTLLAGVRF